MNVTIQISHGEGDDLAQLSTAAQKLGWAVTSRGGFMGKHQTEIRADIDAASLTDLLELARETKSVAA